MLKYVLKPNTYSPRSLSQRDYIDVAGWFPGAPGYPRTRPPNALQPRQGCHIFQPNERIERQSVDRCNSFNINDK
jgi:hypothetical protein